MSHNDLDALENILKNEKDVVSFLFEPIQGEAGVNVPDDNYIKGVSLCSRYNALMIADEFKLDLEGLDHFSLWSL